MKRIGQTRTHRGFDIPTMMYGTAWKEAQTRTFTLAALNAGFRAIDTANQRKHYAEADVGEAVRHFLENTDCERDALFLQTKYTFQAGQDHRLPYDPQAKIAEQVAQSIASSLEHLHTDWLDAYILHGPSRRFGLIEEDLEAWHAIEHTQKAGQARMIGVSNVTLEQLQGIVEQATIPPAFVQNRCFAQNQWDAEVRAYCAQHDIVYQGFSLLTANINHITRPEIQEIAYHHQLTLPQLIFLFSCQIGMLPLTGTTDEQHMVQDLGIMNEPLLTEEDCQTILNIAHNNT